MGDLNYRVFGNRKMVDHCLQSKMFDVLLQNDQLQYNMRAGEVFPGFEEAPSNFRYCPMHI